MWLGGCDGRGCGEEDLVVEGCRLNSGRLEMMVGRVPREGESGERLGARERESEMFKWESCLLV